MAGDSLLSERNREILDEVNRLLMERARDLLSYKVRGERFRAVVHADEAMEVDGLRPYALEDPPGHIDLTRLPVQLKHLHLALCNEDVLAKTFQRTVENEFVIVLDLSRSMRYPLCKLYDGGRITPKEEQIVRSGKPSLLKLVAGAFLDAAAESGFITRIVTFGHHGIEEGQPLRRRPDLMRDLFEDVDRRFREVTAATDPCESSQYEKVVRRLMSRKGIFLFAGDFMDAVFDWPIPAERQRWLRVLGLFRQWGLQRRLLVARINHSEEVRRPLLGAGSGGQMPKVMGDRCDFQVETFGKPGLAAYKDRFESVANAVQRLERQRAWEGRLSPVLRSCCSGYVAVDNRDVARGLDPKLNQMWNVLFGKR